MAIGGKSGQSEREKGEQLVSSVSTSPLRLSASRALNFSANKPKDMSSAARVYKQKQETHTNTHTYSHTHSGTLTGTDTRSRTARQTFICWRCWSHRQRLNDAHHSYATARAEQQQTEGKGESVSMSEQVNQ